METMLYALVALAIAAFVTKKAVWYALERRAENRSKRPQQDKCPPAPVLEPEPNPEPPDHCCYLLKKDRWCKRKPNQFMKAGGKALAFCKQHAEMVLLDIYEGQDPNDPSDDVTLSAALEEAFDGYLQLGGDISKVLTKK